VNTDRFEVQRRSDGSFTTIGTVAAAGNSNGPLNYAFTDTDPAVGDNDYRLRIIDLDGSEGFSHIVTVTIEDTNSLGVVRNGERNYRLSGARPGTKYLLTNAAGAILRRGTVTAETEDINGNGLPAGIYFLVVDRHTFKLVF